MSVRDGRRRMAMTDADMRCGACPGDVRPRCPWFMHDAALSCSRAARACRAAADSSARGAVAYPCTLIRLRPDHACRAKRRNSTQRRQHWCSALCVAHASSSSRIRATRRLGASCAARRVFPRAIATSSSSSGTARLRAAAARASRTTLNGRAGSLDESEPRSWWSSAVSGSLRRADDCHCSCVSGGGG